MTSKTTGEKFRELPRAVYRLLPMKYNARDSRHCDEGFYARLQRAWPVIYRLPDVLRLATFLVRLRRDDKLKLVRHCSRLTTRLVSTHPAS
jgi:hypothetical protein